MVFIIGIVATESNHRERGRVTHPATSLFARCTPDEPT